MAHQKRLKLYIKCILSILILASSLFSANIEVVESFDTTETKQSKPAPIIIETKPSVTINKSKPIKKIQSREVHKKIKKQKKLLNKNRT